MANLTLRSGAYFVRYIVPKDRWRDVGAVLGSKTGIRRDVLKSLQTREYKTALRFRDAALEAIRRMVNGKLVDAGYAPLHGCDVPDWMQPENLIADALDARREIQNASERTDEYDDLEGPSDPRRRMMDGMDYMLEDRTEQLNAAGKDGGRYYRQFREIALGESTPFSAILDRWMKERESTASHSLLSLDRATLNHFSRYLAHSQDLPEPEDLMGFLRSQIVEDVPKRVLGEFAEWLMDEQNLSAKTAANRITPLKVMWDFAIKKHILEGPNPWQGATAGLKRKAGKQPVTLRPYTASELVSLFEADPNKAKRWAWGPAIRDLMRLSLFTGARQNELASLTVGRILNRDGAEGALWGIQVTSDVAKTRNAVRRIPLHPLVQPIIARRLLEADSSNPDALLFPDCKPGGPGMKYGYYFAKRFPDFRKAVLGDASNDVVDFHSFRRSFITYFELANANGAAACTEIMRDRLVGHESKSMAGNTYAARDLGWDLYSRAIFGMVDKGMPDEVKEAV